MAVTRVTTFALFAIALASMSGFAARGSDKLTLHTRTRLPISGSTEFRVVNAKVEIDPRRTAIVICDMWDRHWCDGATARVGELAPKMNVLVSAARGRGVLIIHSPSDTMKFYEGTPQRQIAIDAPRAAVPTPVSSGRPQEPPLPIDDSDEGCDTPGNVPHGAWTREHPAITIAANDAVSDNGDEVYNLLQARGIDNVLIMGVHANMCVLNRPFAIKSLVARGKRVFLVRDMTDTMYNPKSRPYVSHFQGTELVVEHIEKYWCASILSADITGAPPFRFRANSGK